MKLTIHTQISVDGVMQGSGATEQDRLAGYERGGWALAHRSPETGQYVNDVYQRADAFLFGRRTFEIFAPFWSAVDPAGSPIAAALNTRPKYVVSSTLIQPSWADTTVLTGDVASAIRELKAKPGGQLLVPGSSVLIENLLENDLVDEINLLVIPVIVGRGRRLFPDNGPDIALELIESRAFPNGITAQTYRAAGRPKYAAG